MEGVLKEEAEEVGLLEVEVVNVEGQEGIVEDTNKPEGQKKKQATMGMCPAPPLQKQSSRRGTRFARLVK